MKGYKGDLKENDRHLGSGEMFIEAEKHAIEMLGGDLKALQLHLKHVH